MSLPIPLSTYNFSEPESTRVAERLIAVLSENIARIADDLDDKSRRPDPANTLAYADHMNWRRIAKTSLRLKRAHRSFLKGWMREWYEDRKEEQVKTLQDAVDEAVPEIMKYHPLSDHPVIVQLFEVAGWKR